MTPRERAQLRLQLLAERIEPALRARFLQVALSLRVTSIERVAQLLAANDLDGAVRYLFEQPGMSVALTELRAAYAAGVLRLVRDVARDLSGELRVTVVTPVLTPPLIAAVRRWEDGAFANVAAELRLGIRETIALELQRGIGPRQVAVALKSGIGAGGLTAYDAKIIASFRAALEEGRMADALGRALRDKRFDRSLTGKRLLPAQIDKMVEAYRRKLVAFRAETFARAASMQAANEASAVGWHAAVEQGRIPYVEVRRYWVVAQDERLCPTCEPVPRQNPNGTGLDDDFQTPVGAVYAPPLHPNCRCTTFIRREERGVRQLPRPGLLTERIPVT